MDPQGPGISTLFMRFLEPSMRLADVLRMWGEESVLLHPVTIQGN